MSPQHSVHVCVCLLQIWEQRQNGIAVVVVAAAIESDPFERVDVELAGNALQYELGQLAHFWPEEEEA